MVRAESGKLDRQKLSTGVKVERGTAPATGFAPRHEPVPVSTYEDRYSARKAIMGSTRLARWAGIAPANKPTAISKAETENMLVITAPPASRLIRVEQAMRIELARRLILLVALAPAWPCLGQGHPSNDAVEQIVGSWRGHSTCTVKPGPCNDEINVYRISRIPDQLSRVSVVGSKIVDGKTIVMGSGEWKFDSSKHAVESPDGRIRLSMSGNRLEGALTINGAVYRRIFLEKEK
jgi:hypothetical protein